MEDGGRGRLVHDLMHRSLEDFNPRDLTRMPEMLKRMKREVASEAGSCDSDALSRFLTSIRDALHPREFTLRFSKGTLPSKPGCHKFDRKELDANGVCARPLASLLEEYKAFEGKTLPYTDATALCAKLIEQGALKWLKKEKNMSIKVVYIVGFKRETSHE